MRQEVAERQGRRDDLPLLLEVEVVQAVAALRRRHDRHRLRGRVVMVVVVLLMVMVQAGLDRDVTGLVVAGVVAAGRRAGHQVDAAHAYRHSRGVRILEATSSLAAPRPEDRYERRQRSYRVAPVDARIPVCTCCSSRGRRLASSFAALRSRLHGSSVGFARFHVPERAPATTAEILAVGGRDLASAGARRGIGYSCCLTMPDERVVASDRRGLTRRTDASLFPVLGDVPLSPPAGRNSSRVDGRTVGISLSLSVV